MKPKTDTRLAGLLAARRLMTCRKSFGGIYAVADQALARAAEEVRK